MIPPHLTFIPQGLVVNKTPPGLWKGSKGLNVDIAIVLTVTTLQDIIDTSQRAGQKVSVQKIRPKTTNVQTRVLN